MNCKKGDLAVVVRSSHGNEGKVVRCVQFIPAFRRIFADGSSQTTAGWEIDPRLASFDGPDACWAAPDECLRPIRDPGDDATDETLTWLPVPTKVTA
jgi:hypothetical protein